MKRFGVQIAGTGHYVPERVMTNHDLEAMVETSDEWIVARTGIRERHIAAPEQATSDLGLEAALQALAAAEMTPEEVDLIIVATLSPDQPFPNTGCFLQSKLGAVNAACFSLEAACSGFIYALEVASSMIRLGLHKNALIVGAEKLSTFTDWTDRGTCVLFGDGAGAVMLKQCAEADDRMIASKLGSDGRYTDLLGVPAGGSASPLTPETIGHRQNFIKMSGREVFKLAVNAMVSAADDVLAQAGIDISQVRWLVPHQANNRIIQGVGKRMRMPAERVYINVDRYGNTSAATIPIALDEIARGGQVDEGDYILMVAFGGGLTWAAALIRW